MANLVHNEQVKLFATFINNFGVVTYIAIAIVPFFGRPFPPLMKYSIFVVGIVWCIGCHLIAQRWLRNLKE